MDSYYMNCQLDVSDMHERSAFSAYGCSDSLPSFWPDYSQIRFYQQKYFLQSSYLYLLSNFVINLIDVCFCAYDSEEQKHRITQNIYPCL